jgi:hypothetical protein
MQSNRFWHILLASRLFNSISRGENRFQTNFIRDDEVIEDASVLPFAYFVLFPVASLFRSPPPFRERIKAKMLRVFQFHLRKQKILECLRLNSEI